MNTLEAALGFLDVGIETVPLNQYKRPLMRFKDLPITREVIESKANLYLTAPMLAVLCRGVWCIDIDRNHGDELDGFVSLKGISEYQEIVHNASQTWGQKTPSGGRHIIFKKHNGIEYRQKIGYLDGIDIKAHHNNYFVLGGSVGAKGKYELNGKEPIVYQGEFEQRVFSSSGSYEEQTLEKYSARYILKDYDFSHLDTRRTGEGKGKQAYERIVKGQSFNRNEDLFKACSYARACNVSIDPLKVLIGDVKGHDEFTESEFYATVKSAFR